MWEISKETTSTSKGFIKTCRRIPDKIQYFTVPSRQKNSDQNPDGIFTQMKSLFPTTATTVSLLTKRSSELTVVEYKGFSF